MKFIRASTAIAAVLSTCGAVVVAAPAASATSSGGNCVGQLISASNVVETQGNADGTVLGYLNVYWDSSTGENCAVLNSASGDWGTSKWMSVDIFEVGNPYNDKSDNNYYKYYAGPVSVPGAGRCIDADATITIAAPSLPISGNVSVGPFC